MKIAVTSLGPTLISQLDPRFGRCSTFMIVETDTMDFEAVENTNGELGGGAGIQSASVIASKGATVVLTGNCGPNAHQALTAAGIGVVVGCSGTVKEIVERYRTGQYTLAQVPNVTSHAGQKHV